MHYFIIQFVSFSYLCKSFLLPYMYVYNIVREPNKLSGKFRDEHGFSVQCVQGKSKLRENKIDIASVTEGKLN